MSKYVIRKSRVDDFESLIVLYKNVVDHMFANDINQWDHEYPSEEIIRCDIESGHHFVISEGHKVIATMVLDSNQDEQYKTVHWKSYNKDVLVIHRLAVSPLHEGKGLATLMCEFAEEYARKNGYKSIRLDAYAGNKRSNKLYYEKLGYSRAGGFCYFRRKAIPFYCYEKEIPEIKKPHSS